MSSWRDQIQKHTVVRPAAIAHADNGRLPSSALALIYDGHGTATGELEATAARAWNAMSHAAAHDGVTLASISSYRTYDSQAALVRQRYDHTDHGRGGFTWDGKHWYLKPGYATVAKPGTSNHGLGLAVDTNHTVRGVLGWLEAHAHEYGFEWEVTSEEWHVRYWPGDQIPQAVLDHEGDDDLKLDAEDRKFLTDIQAAIHHDVVTAQGMIGTLQALLLDSNSGALVVDHGAVSSNLRALQEDVDAIKAKLGA